MANELTCSGSLQFSKGAVNPVSMTKSGVQFNVAGTRYVRGVFSVPTTANGTAIPLGNNGSVGWFYIENNDSTNYVQILNAVSGEALIRLYPGEFTCGRFDTTVTAPAAQANTAVVQIEYMFVEI
jgi:hypothetical protein